MFDTSRPEGPLSFGGRLGNALVWIGAVLLVIGALVAGPSLAPYVASRLYPLPPRQFLDPSSPLAAPEAAVTNAAEESSGPPLLPLFEQVPEEPRIPATPLPVATPVSTPTASPPDRIAGPSIGVDAGVVRTSWEVADVGGTSQPVWKVPEAPLAGWHDGSAPLGVPGNTVINGHNWPQNAVFRDLYQVRPGEWILLYSNDALFWYEIAEVLLLPEAGQPLEVRQDNARYIQPTDDERVTLVTCHPYGQLTNRLIVIARPAEPAEFDPANR
jgi:sortase A